jgi:phage shock protein A
VSEAIEDPETAEMIGRIAELESVILTYRSNMKQIKADFEEALEPFFEKRERREIREEELLAALEDGKEKMRRRAAEEKAMFEEAMENLTKKKSADDYLSPAN